MANKNFILILNTHSGATVTDRSTCQEKDKKHQPLIGIRLHLDITCGLWSYPFSFCLIQDHDGRLVDEQVQRPSYDGRWSVKEMTNVIEVGSLAVLL